MAEARPITAVGALEATEFGTAALENAAQGVFPVGIEYIPVRGTDAIHDPSVNGANLTFDFAGSYEPEEGANVPFHFDGAPNEDRPVFPPSIPASNRYGGPTVENAADALYPESFQGRLGAPQVYDGAATGGALAINFTGSYTPETALNVPFYFGVGLITTGVGAIPPGDVGSVEIEQTAALKPEGIPSPRASTPFVYDANANGANLDFDFEDAYTPRLATNVPFHFSAVANGTLVVPRAGLGAQDAYGTASVENLADALYPVGVRPPGVGQTIIYDAAINGARLNFVFAQEYIPLTGQSVRFDFAVQSGFVPSGFNALAFGTHDVENTAEALYLDGFDAAAYGEPEVILGGFDQTIEPDGVVTAQFGSALVFYPQDVVVTGFVASAYGAPSFTYDQVIDPIGIPPGTVYGDALVRDKAELLQLVEDAGGFKAVRFGDQHVELFNRTLPVTGEDTALFGQAHLAYDTQEVKTSGFGGGVSVPDPLVSYYVRYLNQIGATHANFGQPDVAIVDLTKTVTPDGVLGAAFGATQLELFIRTIYPQGKMSDGDFGRYTDVRNVDREVYPYGLPPGHLGTPHVQEIIDYPIAPLGGDLSSYGTPAVENVLQAIYPDGIAGIVSEYAAVYIDQTGLIFTGGFDQARYGDAAYLRLGQFFVELNGKGIQPGGISGGDVSAAQRWIAADDPIIGTAFGNASLASTIQPPIEVEDIPPIGFGDVFVGYRVRYIEPQAFDRHILGQPLMGFAREIAPEGLDATQYGPDTEVRDDTLRVSLPGIPPPGFETTVVTVEFYTRTIGAETLGEQTGFPRGGLEQHDVRNDWQFVYPYTDTEQTWGPFFGNFNYVYNRDRTIGVVGFDAAKVSNAREVRNKAIPLYPAGFAGEIGTAFVADRVRHVEPESVAEFTATSRYTIVLNDARVLGPFGQDQDSYGTPDVRNLNRTVKHVFPAEGEAHGLPFVAYAVREISFFQGIKPLAFPVPEAFNSDQYIEAEGFAPRDATGAHDVNETFNIIAPRYQLDDRYGSPYVYNVTPELGTYGRDDSRYGEPSVRLEFRTVYAAGNVTTLYGRPSLTRGIRYLGATGFRAFTSDRFTRVELGDPGLPTTQTIQAQGFPDVVDLRDLIGRPHIREARIELAGLDQSKYGGPDVRSNGIAPKGMLLLTAEAFGLPTLYPDQIIDLSGFGMSGYASKSPTHRVSPHTIWATFDTPRQAEMNHPESEGWEYMDYAGPGDRGDRPFFGQHRVTNENRTIYQYSSFQPPTIGTPRTELAQRFIQPEGARPFRYGLPNLLGGDLGLQAFSVKASLEMGSPAVAYYVAPDVTRTLAVEGFAAYRNGANRVQNFHRSMKANGWDADGYGEAWVSPSPRLIEHSGKKQTKHGLQWASNYIRTLYPKGSDTAAMDYGLGFFDDRMYLHIDWHVTPGAGDQSAFGAALVDNHTRSVRQHDMPTGAVGRPAARARSIVALGGYGLLAGAFGDIDRWEAGKVKAHGDEMLRCGPPLLSRVINAPGIEGVFGSASIGRGVYPLSMAGEAFGAPAITLDNPHGCGQAARAVVPSPFATSEYGAHAVT